MALIISDRSETYAVELSVGNVGNCCGNAPVEAGNRYDAARKKIAKEMAAAA
jgi:hypothetical protein